MLPMHSPTRSDWYGKIICERLVQAPKVQYIIANEMRKLAKIIHGEYLYYLSATDYQRTLLLVSESYDHLKLYTNSLDAFF